MPNEVVFSWPGKESAQAMAETPTTAQLSFMPEQSVFPETTENWFIEGDNLDALKILLPELSGRVKMIYIDPPYNTGKDFVYPDAFGQKRKAALGRDSGPSAGTRASSCGGRLVHAPWLNMILPRLVLAKQLLSNEGAIFISIDDTEAGHLRLLGNELFGEENFVGTLVWLTTKGAQGIPRRQMIASNHEYIFCWAKNGKQFRFRGTERSEEGFSNPDNDPRGPWKRQYVQRFGQGFRERTITDPKTGRQFIFESPYTEENLNKWVDEGRIAFPAQDGYPMRKEFLREYRYRKQLTTFLGLYPTKANTEQLIRLFEGQRVFDSPKPLNLIELLIDCTTEPGDVVVDFFAGSGTTGHAVMNLNARDGIGPRRFVLIEKPQPCGRKSQAVRHGWETTSQICRERLRRACLQILDETKRKKSATPSNEANENTLSVDKSAVSYSPGVKCFRLTE